MLKKTVLDYRYGHYALLGLTEDFVFVCDLIKGTVSDYFLINVECKLESTAAETLDCVHRWSEADKLRFAPQISKLKAHVRACYSLITQPADNSDVLSEPEPETRLTAVLRPQQVSPYIPHLTPRLARAIHET